MKILFCGDVVGRAGRKAIAQYIPVLREELSLDFVIINGENAASGFGVTQKICNSFVESGVDAITSGDHVFDQKEVFNFIGDYEKLLRPANYPSNLPGRGFNVFICGDDKKILVIHLQAQLFMKVQADCPFAAVDKILDDFQLGGNIDAIYVDFHGEATSEKVAMGHHLDGRVSAVSGSHTHIPTSDFYILDGQTAFQTDTGMCGDYNSVIGFTKEVSLEGFLNKARRGKLQPAKNEPTLCGLYVETDDQTGLAINIAQVIRGGKLSGQKFL